MKIKKIELTNETNVLTISLGMRRSCVLTCCSDLIHHVCLPHALHHPRDMQNNGEAKGTTLLFSVLATDLLIARVSEPLNISQNQTGSSLHV